MYPRRATILGWGNLVARSLGLPVVDKVLCLVEDSLESLSKIVRNGYLSLGRSRLQLLAGVCVVILIGCGSEVEDEFCGWGH